MSLFLRSAMPLKYFEIHQEVRPLEHLRYRLEDGRQIEVMYIPLQQRMKIIEMFESDGTSDLEIQRMA